MFSLSELILVFFPPFWTLFSCLRGVFCVIFVQRSDSFEPLRNLLDMNWRVLLEDQDNIYESV